MNNNTQSPNDQQNAASPASPGYRLDLNGQAPLVNTGEQAIPIAKPDEFDISRFKSKRAKQASGVGTLQMALPHHKIAAARDFVRLHPNEETHWTDELSFVNIPIKGQKGDLLHLIDEDLVPASRIDEVQHFAIALATKPFDVFSFATSPRKIWTIAGTRARCVRVRLRRQPGSRSPLKRRRVPTHTHSSPPRTTTRSLTQSGRSSRSMR